MGRRKRLEVVVNRSNVGKVEFLSSLPFSGNSICPRETNFQDINNKTLIFRSLLLYVTHPLCLELT